MSGSWGLFYPLEKVEGLSLRMDIPLDWFYGSITSRCNHYIHDLVIYGEGLDSFLECDPLLFLFFLFFFEGFLVDPCIDT